MSVLAQYPNIYGGFTDGGLDFIINYDIKYRKERQWVATVTRWLNGNGFLITAYQTEAIKEGETLYDDRFDTVSVEMGRWLKFHIRVLAQLLT